jgi:hypothetical protein
MQQANRLLQQERKRIGRVASGVAEELKTSTLTAAKSAAEDVKEAGRSVAASVSETVAETAEAVKDRAAKESREVQS